MEKLFKVNQPNIIYPPLFWLIGSYPWARRGLTFVNATTKILDAAKFWPCCRDPGVCNKDSSCAHKCQSIASKLATFPEGLAGMNGIQKTLAI